MARDRVWDLVPFVHVADVERSAAFYELLGFRVTDTYRPEGDDRLEWAWLERAHARIMLARSDEPFDPDAQAALFYPYAQDLAALREHLLAHGVDAGEIHDGTPAPERQMWVTDPDGWGLMIAQAPGKEFGLERDEGS